MVNTNRSLFKYIIFTIFTCGIYPIYYIHALARDLNAVCDGDGEHTSGFLAYFFLSIFTCGLYHFYWNYKVAGRIYNNSERYGIRISEDGTSVLLWLIIGTFLCFIASLFGYSIIMKNANKLTRAFVGR